MATRVLGLFLCSLLGLLGCQSTASTASTAPTPTASPQALPAGAIYRTEASTAGVLGTWRLRYDNGLVELLPTRAGVATVGTLFNVDVTDALSGGFCRDCLRPVWVRSFGSNIEVQFELRHPLPLANDDAPVSAANRRDLWLSSVKLIALVDDGQPFFGGSVRANAKAILYSEGYTGLLPIPAGFTSTIFPYDALAGTGLGNYDSATGWTQHLDDPTGYGIFPNNTTRTGTVNFRAQSAGTFEVDMLLTASFAASVPSFEQRLAPTYYMPAGAAPEPWRVHATPEFQAQLTPAEPDSSLKLKLTAYDWQQDPALAVDPAFPNPANPKGLAVASRIDSVQIDIPGIWDAPKTIDISGATGTGAGTTPWELELDVFNEAAALPGTYYGLVKFTDERDPAATGTFDSTTFVGADLATPYAAPSEFATYAAFEIKVNLFGGCSGFGQGSVASGSYPDNIYPGDLLLAFSNEADFQAGWDLFFSNPKTRPPLPVIDFVNKDVVFFSTGYKSYGDEDRSVFTTGSCWNEENEYLRLEGYRYETQTCQPGGPSHPWCVTPVTKGAAGWRIHPGISTLNACP